MSKGDWLHRYALFTSFMTLLLLCAGALVTGTGSGLAVPDWPLSYGQFFPPMVGGVLYEHGHRMIAGSVGILTLILALWIWLKEDRAWLKWLAGAALLAVVLQATLGGLTVILRLPTGISIAHACLAQIFFCLVVVIALVTAPSWKYATVEKQKLFPLSLLSVLLAGGFFVQLLLGAMVRHLGAGLAIPDFPLVFGGLVPPQFSTGVVFHYAHRIGAFSLVFLVAVVASVISRKHERQLDWVGLVGILLLLVLIQVTLGALVIWFKRPIPITTIHLAVGALCLASSVALTCKIYRVKA